MKSKSFIDIVTVAVLPAASVVITTIVLAPSASAVNAMSEIIGNKFFLLRTEREMKQKDLDDRSGITRYTLSR